MSLINKQNEVSFWVGQYSDELYAWALCKTPSEAIAQDIIQETFLAAFQNWEDFKRESSPKTWLFSILKNKITDYFRQVARNKFEAFDDTNQWFDEDGKWKNEFRPEPWENTNACLLDNPEFEEILAACIGNLPPSWSACVQLKYLNEKETEEICQQLNITASNLWQILHRAKLSLRNCLEKNWFKPK